MGMIAKSWTLSALSTEFRVDRRRMGTILSGVSPCGTGPRGQPVYRIAAVVAALTETATASGAPADLADAELRKAAADAELKELRLARERAELISVEDLARMVEGEYTAMRSRLLAIPSKLAPELAQITDAAEAQAALEVEIHEALIELGRDELRDADLADTESGQDSEPADRPRRRKKATEARASGTAPTAEADSLAVGGRGAATKPRGLRRGGSVANQSS